MNEPEITRILKQFSTHEICDAYLVGEDDADWQENDFWASMPKKYFIADLFRRVAALEGDERES